MNKTNEKSCLIISGGDFFRPDNEIIAEADLIIACDKGYRYAVEMGVRPDLIVGDFDSSSRPEDTDIAIMEFPSRKDYTDTMIAVMHALDQGCCTIDICCALGGRLDHTYSNVETLAYAASRGAKARILAGDTQITVFADGEISLDRKEGWSLSVFSRSDRSEGVSIRGTEYQVTDIELTNCLTLGQSNLIREARAVISVRRGMLVVIESKLRKGEHI